jgi:hypothetical protein
MISGMRKSSMWLKKLLAILCGLVVFAITFAINMVGILMLYEHLHKGKPWAHAQTNIPLVVGYEWVGPVFEYAYPTAVGLATMVFFWRGVPKESARIAIYVLILMLVGPLTFINYLMSDQWLNLWVQLAFNLVVAFVGYVLVLKLRDVKTEAADLKALQSLSILLIASLLIALPLFYSAIFLAFALHLIKQDGVNEISKKIPAAVAGIAGVVAVLLNNLDSIRSKKTKEKEA